MTTTTGDHTTQTPPFSVSLLGQHEIPTPPGHFDLNLSSTHTDRYYASADHGKGQIAPSSSNNNRQKRVDIFNGSVGWSTNSRDLEVRLWAKNLTYTQHW